MIYDVGDLVQLSTTITDLTGTAVNTPTVTLSVIKPDASTTAPTVTNSGAGGIYTATVTTDQAGTWTYVWTASGSVVAVQTGQFTVTASSSPRVLVASLEELKAHLNKTGTTDDVELRSYLESATDWVEWAIGGPLSVTSYTEYVCLRNRFLMMSKRPVVAVTSVTPQLASTIDSSYYVLDTVMNAIRFLWGGPMGWYTVVYTAGLSVVPERVKLAGLIVAAHLWRTQNGGGGVPFPGEEPTVDTGYGFAVPNRASELLAPSRVPGFA